MGSEMCIRDSFRAEFEFFLVNHVLLDSVNRVARQDTPDKREVLHQLLAYVRKHIPKLSQCESYRRESRNRRLIMLLNYRGLYGLSQCILNTKARLSGR